MNKPTQKPKRKDTRQRKFMELSVYNKLIDQFNELQSENKRLKHDAKTGFLELIKANELLSQCRHNRSIISLQRDEFKQEAAKQKARKELYRAATIFLAACLCVGSIYVIW